ncbi:MAG: mechanosensitive ion channel family protein [Saprospiraceae bacterium]|nr:mechanosensitive ion channel family protein [Saprospiraceae bacterium]
MKNYYYLIFLFILAPACLMGQRAETPEIKLDNPYNSMYVHLHFLQQKTFAPDSSAKALDVGELAPELARRRAIQLKQILDGKGLYVRFGQIPQDSNYYDSTARRAVYIPFPEALPEVYLEKRDSFWLYSPETVSSIPRLHKAIYPFGADFLLNLFPQFGQTKVLGFAIWQLSGIVIMIVLAFLLHFLLSRALNPIVKRLSSSRLYPSLVAPSLVKRIAQLLSVWIIVRILKIFIPALQFEPEALISAVRVANIVSTLLVMLIALRVLDILMLYFYQLTQRTENKLDEQVVPILKRSLQAVIILWAIFQALNLLEVNVTALIAGVSIGGLAIALAAQDTVKNLIGSAMIFVDKPFQIGDFIDLGGFSGTVEEVGFRTTRIRKSDSSLVAVPNGVIANQSITNLGVRVYRLFQTQLGITYNTPPERIELFTDSLKQLILSHPYTQKEGYYVHLSSLADSSLSIMFRAPLQVPDYGTELRVKEELLLAILRIAESLDISFAFPSSSIYVESMPTDQGQKEQPTGDLAPAERVQKLLDHLKQSFNKDLP